MRKAKFMVLLAGLAGWVGGCAQTVTPEKFLYLYRRSASPGHMDEGGFSRYTGKDLQYHYLNVQTSTLEHGAEQVLLYGAYRDQTFRCPVGALPHDFPEGFRQLYQDGKRSEPEEETYRYVNDYLSKGSSVAPPSPPPPAATGACNPIRRELANRVPWLDALFAAPTGRPSGRQATSKPNGDRTWLAARTRQATAPGGA